MPDFTDLDTLLGAKLMVPRFGDASTVTGHDPTPVVDRRCEKPGCDVVHVERWFTLLLQCALCTELHVSVLRYAHGPDGEHWTCPHCGLAAGFANKGTARRMLEQFAQAAVPATP